MGPCGCQAPPHAEGNQKQKMNEKETFNNPITAEVVVAGHICLDIIRTLASSTALLAPGRLIEAGPAILSTGGPVSNTGLALHKLGIVTRLMGKIGTDLFGQAIRQLIASYEPELAEGIIVVPGETS